MLQFARWKIWTIITICLFGMLFSFPNLLSPQQVAKLPSWLQNTINLGLELRGGSHLQFEVDLKTVLKDQSENLLDEVRTALRAHKIGYTGLVLTPDKKGITFVLRDPAQKDKVDKLISKSDYETNKTYDTSGRVTVLLTDKAINDHIKQALEKSKEVIRRRIDESGTKEPTIQQQGIDRIIVQLPGVENPAEVKRLIGKTAKLEFRLVDESLGGHGQISMGENGRPTEVIPAGSEVLPELDDDGQVAQHILVKKQVAISGDRLTSAQVGFTEGRVGVSISFDSTGTKKFAELTQKHIGHRFAIVLDNKIISAPVMQAIINDGHSIISGSFSNKSAATLALLLRSGSLPAPLNVIEERTVGPSLGEDSIHDGKRATIFAFILVAMFMFLNYSRFGLFADIALAFNLMLLFAALSLLQATLTLPGIAGIALTIGMAVDANVLIYERIKEELRNGVRAAAAIEMGYNKAFTTIIDSNLTTLIGAAVLFEFGSGPIRGFAVTLSLGIVISLFTALSLTKLIIYVWMRRQKNITTLPI